jgi:hypothetical protein
MNSLRKTTGNQFARTGIYLRLIRVGTGKGLKIDLPAAMKPLFRAVGSIEKTEQHLAGGLDVVADALAHRGGVAGDEALQHEVMLCIGRMIIS